MLNANADRRTAFVITELVGVIAVALALMALLFVVGGETRRQARLGEDMAKFRHIAAWTASYGGDNADQFWSLSWRKGLSLSVYPDLNNATTDVQAGANQAVDIMRRVGGREDMPVIRNWLPHRSFAHLTLLDYAKTEIPSLMFVSAGNANRLKWARDPAGFDLGIYQPAPPLAVGNTQRCWPYGSTFDLGTSFYDASAVHDRIAQCAQQFCHSIPSGAAISPRLRADAAFPSQKVHLHDDAAWHFGNPSHCVIPDRRAPLLFVDGSVRVTASADTNPGWIPYAPTANVRTTYLYEPRPWEPGTNQFINAGRFRWTRGYVQGRDVGGPEACTGQSGCP